MPVVDLTPNSTTETTNWGANPHLALDDPPDSPDDAATTTGNTTTTALGRYRVGLSAMPDMISASKVTLRTRLIGTVGQGAGVTAKPYIYVNAVRYYATTITAPEPLAYTTHELTWTTNPNTSLPWTKADLDALECGVEYSPTGDPQDALTVTQQSARVEYVAASALIGAAVDVGSRRLWLVRSLLPTIVGRMPGWVVDRELFESAYWTHRAGLRTSDEGWGMKVWERGLGLSVSQETDLDDPAWATTLEDLDVRRYWVMDWDPMISEEPPGTGRPGIPSINAGAGRTYVRTLNAWVENAAAAAQGLKQVVMVPPDVEKCATNGTLLEGSMTNDLLRSSFVDGLTGLTAVGTAGQTTLDTADLLFDPAVTPNSLKITRNATAEDQGRTWPATAAYAANDRVMVSIDYKNDSSVALSWYLRRSSDSNYYRDSDSTWQAATQYNAPTVSTSPARAVSKVIDVGSGTPTLTLSIVHRSADADGTVSHVYHAQIEESRWASSRIVTTTATVTRSADSLKLENFDGKRVYRTAQGTTLIKVLAGWNSADLASGARKVILHVYYDASNEERLEYDKDSGSFRYIVKVAATTYTASKTQTVTRGTLYRLAIRRTGVQAELDLAAHTLSIFIDGVKGTDAVAVANGSLPASPYLFIGHDQATANHWDGWLQDRRTTPVVYSDDEITGDS